MNPEEKRKCGRCNRSFTPTKEGQLYGPKCAKKMKGQGACDDRTAIARQAVIG